MNTVGILGGVVVRVVVGVVVGQTAPRTVKLQLAEGVRGLFGLLCIHKREDLHVELLSNTNSVTIRVHGSCHDPQIDRKDR